MTILLSVLVMLNVFLGTYNAQKGNAALSALSLSSAALCFCTFIEVISK